MSNHLYLALVAALLLSGCASFGPTVLIETPEPVDDFVLLCEWQAKKLISLHGGSFKQVDEKAYVISSGEEQSCGLSIWGNHNYAVAMHPLYRGGTSEERDSVTVIRPKTKLQYLDELKAKFEAGYWDKFKWPADQFVFSVRGVCLGTFDHYFGYYLSAVDYIDFDSFKSKYYGPILECRCKEEKFYSDNRIRDGIRKEYTDPEKILSKWWDKLEEIANEYK